MTTQPSFAPVTSPSPSETVLPQQYWTLSTRLAFRFCCTYFFFYCLLTQIGTGLLPVFSDVDIPELSSLTPTRQIVAWVGAHVLRLHEPVVYAVSGSGDRTFDWVFAFALLIFSVLITVLWSALARRSTQHPFLYKWFRLFLRFALAGQMIGYGLAKAIPLQMPFPYLVKLVEPIGNLSPMGMLWTSIGASPAYESFAGCAELLGGILLIIPRTTTLGALLCLADMTQVFTLNMTYDVPVKLLSFHLLLMSVFLLAPDLQRLMDFFILNRPAVAGRSALLFQSAGKNRIALSAQLAFGALLLTAGIYTTHLSLRTYGSAAPRSPLYGIWNVESASIDSASSQAPVASSPLPWRRVIFEFPKAIAVQKVDDSVQYYAAALTNGNATLNLSKSSDKDWKSDWTLTPKSPGQMTMEGSIDGHKVHLDLKLMDRNKFLLVSRGFHWVQEKPFNR